MGQMEPPDLGEQSAIGRLAWAFGPAAPSIIPRCRDAHDIAQDPNRERLALILDEAEFHFGGSEKMRSVFLRNFCCLRFCRLLQDISEYFGAPP
jgi:hypothetical protein